MRDRTMEHAPTSSNPSARVGLLQSLSGTMALSEQPLLDAERMAIAEINARGGVLGCDVEPVIADGASVPETFAQRADELLISGVKSLFGCWTSASRKAVRPVVEAAAGLLWYPVETTGLWGEAVRQRRPVITNDYQAPNPLKKGYPGGHVPVRRHMNLPVFDRERIVLVAGVGNKEARYDESDVRQLTLLMQGMWQLIQRKRMDDALHHQQQLAQQQLRDIIEFLPDATFVIDQTKRVIAWNREMEALTGVAKDAILGRGEYAYAASLYGTRRPLLVDLLEAQDPAALARYDYVQKRDHTWYAETFAPSLYGVVEADHGVQGLAVFAQEHPDVVVCDLRMPELDGFGVLAYLQQQSPATPVVIITGTGDIGARAEVLAPGACAYFLKPINDLGQLAAVIQQAWERAWDVKEKP